MVQRFLLTILLLLAAHEPVQGAGGPTISGRVLAPSGEGLPDARVELTLFADHGEERTDHGEKRATRVTVSAPAPERGALTDAQGRFRLDAPSTGPWILRAAAEGWVAREFLLASLDAPRELEPVTLPRDTGLSVRVTGPGGEPRVDVRVTATPRSVDSEQPSPGWRPVAVDARTGDDGSVRLPWAAGEAATLRAAGAGYIESNPLMLQGPATATTATAALVLRRATVIHGVVLNPTGRPLPEATIEVRNAHGPGRSLAETLSTATGGFRFHALPVGSYEVHAHKEGFGAGRLRVETDGPGPALRVVLHPGRPVFGLVLDDDEQPVPGARITLAPRREDRSATPTDEPPVATPSTVQAETDAEGMFHFPAVDAPKLRLTARAAGFAPMVVAGLTMPAGEEPWDLGTLVLAPGSDLAGQVVDEEDSPIANASLTAVPTAGFAGAAGGSEAAAERTDAEGRFVLADLPRGLRVDLTVRAPGYALKTVSGVEAEAGEELRIVLREASRLAGRVVTDNGWPIARATVEVRWPRTATAPLRFAITDAEGAFALTDLLPGQVTLQATAEGYAKGPQQGADLALGDAVEGVELVLRRGSTVTGRLRGPDAAPVADARVEIRPRVSAEARRGAGEGSRQTTTDARGWYRLAGVEPGGSLLVASHPNFSRAMEQVEVRVGDNTFDLVLERGYEVSGRVIGDDGSPVAGTRLTLVRQGPPPAGEQVIAREGTSGSEGVFRIRGLTDGSYRLRAEREGFATTLLSDWVEVYSGPVTGLEVTLRRGGAITGELLGLDFDELAHVEVRAASADGLTAWGEIDPLAGYRLSDLAHGEWSVVATVARSGRRAAGRVTVAPGADPAQLDLDFESGLVLSGRVFVDGEVGAGLGIHLRSNTTYASGTATTGGDGKFRIEGLEPGDYELEVSEPTSGLHHVEALALAADRRMTLQIVTSGLDGRVVAADTGEALDGVRLTLDPQAGTKGRPLSKISDGAGTFRFSSLAAGTYQLTAEKRGYAAQRSLIELRGSHEETELVLAPGEGLELRVVSPSGAPPHAVDIAFFDPAGQTLVAGTYPVDLGGRVELTTVPPESGLLAISAGGEAISILPLSLPAATVDVALEQAAGLHVVVPDLAGSNLQAEAHLFDARGVPLHLPLPGGRVSRPWPLADGQTVLGGLPPGQWWIRVTAGDGRTWEGETTLVSGWVGAATLN